MSFLARIDRITNAPMPQSVGEALGQLLYAAATVLLHPIKFFRGPR